jgi:ThiS family.
MIIYIKAFANFREILGRDSQVELDKGSKVRELLDSLCLSQQRLKSALFDESGRFESMLFL